MLIGLSALSSFQLSQQATSNWLPQSASGAVYVLPEDDWKLRNRTLSSSLAERTPAPLYTKLSVILNISVLSYFQNAIPLRTIFCKNNADDFK